MATRIIELKDGVRVEVELTEDQVQQLSGGITGKIGKKFENISPVLLNICEPIVGVIEQLNQEANVEQMEIQLGLSFEAEGNIYVTKMKTAANLNVNLIIKPKGSKREKIR